MASTDATDGEQVRTVLARYCDAIDALDIERLSTLFSPEVTADLRGIELDGRDELMAFVRDRLGRFVATSHHVGGEIVDIDGDAAHLSAQLYAYHRADDGGTWEVWGRYEIDLRRDGDGSAWLVHRHELHGIGERSSDGTVGPTPGGHPRRVG